LLQDIERKKERKNGEILKGARSSIDTRMEGSICELLAAKETNKEN
jgi:hypothetical protein